MEGASGSSESSGCDPNDSIYFNQRASREGRGLNRRAGGARVADEAAVHLVERRKVGHVVEVDRRLHDVGPGCASGLEHGTQVPKDLLGLLREAAVDEATGLWIDRDLARGEQQTVRDDA